MRKILFVILIIMLSTTACTNFNNITEVSTPDPVISEEPQPTDVPTDFALKPHGFSDWGMVAETDAYTFFTDFKHIFRMDNQTGETETIFTSEGWVIGFLEYAGYIYANDSIIDYNGNQLFSLPDSIGISFAADGYLYYDYGGEIKRRKIPDGKDECIFNRLEIDSSYDKGSFADYFDYYNGKVYFQENSKIYSINEEGVKTYCGDGEFISLKDSRLVFQKEGKLYSKDLKTGNEKEVYNSQISFRGEYIGSYNQNEYYEVDDKIIFVNSNSDQWTEENQLPFDYVESAVVSNGWIYMNWSGEFIKYNIETKQSKTIASQLAIGQDLFICNNHIYYIDDKADGIYSVDLVDGSSDKIYNGSIYLDFWYI